MGLPVTCDTNRTQFQVKEKITLHKEWPFPKELPDNCAPDSK